MASILVTGATGYIGGRLVPELLAAGHEVRCLVRSPSKLSDVVWRDDVTVVEGSITDADALARGAAGADVAYYLVHSMGTSPGFEAEDRKAGACFRDAAAAAGVGRIVYLGGLGRDDDPQLSRHLRSRHEVGRLLAAGGTPVIELRAALIIGSGSASFEMLRYLVEVLPVMVTPRWVENRCQPIAIRDVLRQLVAAAERTETDDEVLEIGGPDVLTYREMMGTYAEVAGLPRRVVLGVPLLTPKLSSLWIGLVTPLPTGLARPLVESLINEVIVTRPTSGDTVADALPFRRAVELALSNSAEQQIATRWSDAALPGRSPADPLPSDPDWAGGSLLVDESTATSGADAHTLFATVEGIGGKRGWYVTPFLWGLRGALDKLVGGVGMRRGRRDPDHVRVGDAVDFWRVEAAEPDRLLRFRAEMRLPGEAWIDWRVTPHGDGTLLTQRAIFYPRGLLGRLYWYVLIPFHALIFARLARRLAAVAERHADPHRPA